jgi:hypothetical protein
MHLSSNGNLDLDTGLNVDDDLLDDLSWGVKTVELLMRFLTKTKSDNDGATKEGGQLTQ